jgi:hypothetical protein
LPILRDVPVELKPENIMPSRGKRRVQPALLRDAAEAIALGRTLWQPAAVYDWFDVHTLDGEHVTLVSANGAGTETTLHIGPKADLLVGAARVLASVITIGPALEQRVEELLAAGENLKAYLLDSAGVAALGCAGEAVRCVVEEAAAAQGWGVSPSLSPGSLMGWSLRGQRDLCALLPLEDIDVQLNEYCVLVPHKSASSLVGLGPGYDSAHVGSVCRFCALQDTCWRRREDVS